MEIPVLPIGPLCLSVTGGDVDLTLLRMSGGVLVPSTPADAEVIRLMPIGTTIQAQGRGRRNPAFHRRFFALLNLTFDYWEPTGGLGKVRTSP